MQKISTPTSQTPQQSAEAMLPSKKTIAVIRQFARIYMPMSNMPGVVLN